MPESEFHRTPPPPKGGASLAGWRLWGAILLLLVVAAVTISLGRWQLSRADQKKAIAERIESARQQAPLSLSPTVDEAELVEWREAIAHGAWQPGLTVFLDNRNHEGRPGFWVVTPFCLRSPDAPPEAQEGAAMDCDRAIAVLRGWVARPLPGEAALPALPALEGPAVLQGRLLAHLPRLFDLSVLTPGGSESVAPPSWDAGSPLLQNLSLDTYAQASGLAFLPVVLEQHNNTGDGLLREWAGPPVDVDKHRGYALQWFSFAAIAFIALGVVLVKALRRSRR